MATFHIHQDPEKENTLHALQDKNHSLQNARDRRPTLAALTNIPVPRAQQGKKTALREIRPGKTQQNIVKDARDLSYGGKIPVPAIKSSNHQTAHVPVEQFKSFSVYEDEPTKPESSGNRVPFKEVTINDGLVHTPMSVGESPSPMSIDRTSHMEEEVENNRPVIPFIPTRNERDRIFEVEEYQLNILEYYRELERKYKSKPGYMQKQPDINHSMRSILVDWLVEVAEEYRLQNETLNLAVSYVDRFLSLMSVVRVKLQLVGTAAMFVAAKYEEIYPPDVGEFVYITDDTYTKTQVLRMEQVLLKTLSFSLCVPTTVAYINAYSILLEIPEQLKHLMTYLCELSLLEGDPFLNYEPSRISAGALVLGRHILEMPMWCPKTIQVTSYPPSKLKDVIFSLCKMHNMSLAMAQQAIQEKYKSSKYMQVATIPPVHLNEEQYFIVLKEHEPKPEANENRYQEKRKFLPELDRHITDKSSYEQDKKRRIKTITLRKKQ